MNSCRNFSSRLLMPLLAVLLVSCVSRPQTAPGHAELSSNYPVVAVNGEAIDQVYQLQIPQGEVSLTVVYYSVQHDYHCRFQWLAQAGNRYEITDHMQEQPLTLYRWQWVNGLWSRRAEPTPPVVCQEKPASWRNEEALNP